MTALKPLMPNIPRLDMLQPGPRGSERERRGGIKHHYPSSAGEKYIKLTKPTQRCFSNRLLCDNTAHYR